MTRAPVLTVALLAALLVAATSAPAATIGSLGTSISARWTPDPNGTYASRDARNVGPFFDEYAAAMLGASQVMSGRPSLVRRGLRSLVAACRHPNYHREFQVLGIASGYLSLQQQGLPPAYPAAARTIRGCLAGIRPTAYGWAERGRYFGNAQVVDYAAYRLARRAGVHPVRWDRFRRRAERILDGMRRLDGDDGACIIGDPPRFPLAYHVLTTALLRLAGRPLPCAELALESLQAPNGDVAWSGRTYLQSWTLAASAYLFARVGDPMRAGRAMARLTGAPYRAGTDRFHLNPCNCRQDAYAQRPAYAGLTAWWLSLAGARTAGDPQPELGGTSLATPLYRITATADHWTALRAGRVTDDWRLTPGVVREAALVGGAWRVLSRDLAPR